jgi:uncharacterized RDD family membrane protein YckC
MPIPIYREELEPRPTQALRLVTELPPATERPAAAFLYPRTLAHCFDVAVVQGFSAYAAKFLSLALISGHMGEIQDTGKLASGIFADTLAYGNSQVFLASFIAISVLYFIGMPLLVGRTFGLGIFGLKVENERGEKPSFSEAATRFGVLAASFLSLGLLFAVGLRRRDGRFLHDQVSGTKVVKS